MKRIDKQAGKIGKKVVHVAHALVRYPIRHIYISKMRRKTYIQRALETAVIVALNREGKRRHSLIKHQIYCLNFLIYNKYLINFIL